MQAAQKCPANATKTGGRPGSQNGRENARGATPGPFAAVFRSVGPFAETAARLVGRSGVAERELRFLFGYPPTRQVYEPQHWEVRGVLVLRMSGYWVWSKRRGRNPAGWHPLDEHVIRVVAQDGTVVWEHPEYRQFRLCSVLVEMPG